MVTQRIPLPGEIGPNFANTKPLHSFGFRDQNFAFFAPSLRALKALCGFCLLIIRIQKLEKEIAFYPKKNRIFTSFKKVI